MALKLVLKTILSAYFFASLPAFALTAGIESQILFDFLKSGSEKVNAKASNTPPCAKSCTVETYFKYHQTALAKEISEGFGKLKSGENVPEVSFESGCSKEGMIPAYAADLKKAKIKVPAAALVCTLKFAFNNGEISWSEQIYYIKTKVGEIERGSYWAFGTP